MVLGGFRSLHVLVTTRNSTLIVSLNTALLKNMWNKMFLKCTD